MNDRYDCLVIGGGPAGSTAATIVAQAGYRVLLVEREKMPRFHVGESLMPETYWTLERLGVLDRMKTSSFVKKVSVQFISHTGKESQPFSFLRHDPRECSQTWQVERAEFDRLLFDNAADKGATCQDQTRVLQVHFDGARAAGARLQTVDGQCRDMQAKVVVDATGQQSLLANRLGLKQMHPALRNAAIWGYFRKAQRVPGEHGGATVILHTQDKRTWFWYIPLSNDVTSVGVVGSHDYLLKRSGTPATVFARQRAACPALERRLADAELASQLHVAKEFSYTTRQHAGDGWVLVGDAFGFIDPVYSSGVYFALKSGEMAADCLVEGLRDDDTSGVQLGKWTPEFRDATRWIAKLVTAFYTEDFSFGKFMKSHPHHVGNLTNLLIGRIFQDGAGRIFDDMDPWLERAATEAGGNCEGQPNAGPGEGAGNAVNDSGS